MCYWYSVKFELALVNPLVCLRIHVCARACAFVCVYMCVLHEHPCMHLGVADLTFEWQILFLYMDSEFIIFILWTNILHYKKILTVFLEDDLQILTAHVLGSVSSFCVCVREGWRGRPVKIGRMSLFWKWASMKAIWAIAYFRKITTLAAKLCLTPCCMGLGQLCYIKFVKL